MYSNDGNKPELKLLIDEMRKVPDATIKVAVNRGNELLSIYFQDKRMKQLFESYPELIIFDATYKVNNRRMPLFVLLVVDGNGESEIACLWIIKSESREALTPMLVCFKEQNPNWIKVQVLLGDKDWADRSVFREHFPMAELNICEFHVLQVSNFYNFLFQANKLLYNLNQSFDLSNVTAIVDISI